MKRIAKLTEPAAMRTHLFTTWKCKGFINFDPQTSRRRPSRRWEVLLEERALRSARQPAAAAGLAKGAGVEPAAVRPLPIVLQPPAASPARTQSLFSEKDQWLVIKGE